MGRILEVLEEEKIIHMRKKEKIKLKTVRMTLSALKNESIRLGRQLEENEAITILKKEVKSYNESLEFAIKADNTELIEELETSIALIQRLLPQEMSIEKAREIVTELLSKNNITLSSQKGAAMKLVMPILKGQLDGKKINDSVSELLR